MSISSRQLLGAANHLSLFPCDPGAKQFQQFVYQSSSRSIRTVGSAPVCWNIVGGEPHPGVVLQAYGCPSTPFDFNGTMIVEAVTKAAPGLCVTAARAAPAAIIGLEPCTAGASPRAGNTAGFRARAAAPSP